MKPVLPREVVETMARREHRLQHWLWHEVRNSWLSYPDDVKQQLRDKGWEPPRPALDAKRRPIVDNDAGEDFLYMHRQMLVDVSNILARVKDPGYPRVRVWTALPAPGDTDFPVPPAWFDPFGNDEVSRRTMFESLKRLKSDIFYHKRLITWQKMFTDPAFLRGISLGRLGVLMENTIHASMHLRWSHAPAASRPEPGPNEGNTIAQIWDDPRYDFLGDTYSSHVNVVFWSLHGWIDDRIEDWKIANGVYGNDFWKGTWVGKMPADAEPAPHSHVSATLMTGQENPATAPSGVHALLGNPEHDHPAKEDLEETVKIIGECGVFHAGYARVFLAINV